MGFVIVRLLWQFIPPLCNRVPARIAATLVGLACALVYALLAGMQLPTQRALIMLSVYAAAFLLRRRAGAWNALALAAVAVLFWHPPSVLEAGFWLSFGAVAVITATLQGVRGRPRWRQAVSVQLNITLALWPVLALFDMSMSALAPLVNLVLVPVFGVLVVPFSLAGTALGMVSQAGGAMVLGGLSLGLDLLGSLLALAGSLGPPMPGMQGAPVLLTVTVLALLLWLQPAGLPMRPLAGLLLIGLLLPRENAVPAGEFRVQVLDVGQGLAVVVETRAHLLVFDTGPAFSSGFSTASSVVAPYLQRVGARRIDRLVLSHGDRDHAGGLGQLLGLVEVSEILSGEPERVGFGASRCHAGERWLWDGVAFEFLHPGQPTALRGNNASCVLRISNPAGSALLTGDIERTVEQELVVRHADRLASRLVIAPHHGSGSSSSRAFVAATQADYVVFTAGWANRYGFPAADVMQRWADIGARALDTSSAGTLGFRFLQDGRLTGPTRYRPDNRRYWRHDSSSAADVHAVSSGD
jgi:competence protein ComEC